MYALEFERQNIIKHKMNQLNYIQTGDTLVDDPGKSEEHPRLKKQYQIISNYAPKPILLQQMKLYQIH